MRSLIYIACLIIGLILFKLFFLNKKEGGGNSSESPKSGALDKKNSGQAMPVEVYVAEMSTSQNEIFATGTVVANEDVELRPEASGRLVALYIKEGNAVKRGQLIAKIKDDDIAVRIKRIKLEQELALQIEARQKKLLDINAISKEEFEIATNKVMTLNTDLESLKVALAQTEVRAPFDGRIGLKNISIGAYVSPSTIIARLVQISPAKIDFTIPEKYASKVNVGGNISFTSDDRPIVQTAKISAIEPIVDENLRTIKIRSITANNGGKLRPGSYVKVKSTLGVNKSILMPSEAIIPFIGGKKVFAIKNGKAEERTIVTGLRTDTSVEVIEGISVGDSIIISAIMNIKKGQSVKVKPKKN